MILKNKLKKIIDDSGLKIIAVADKANINRKTLNNIVKERHSTSIENAMLIAKALNMTVYDIWELVDEKE